MKKLFTLFAMMFLLVGGLFAQKLSYQAVVRDNDNKLVVNTALTVEVSILNANNGVQYAETHNATSNQNGLIVLTIGEGTVTSGSNLSAVDWEGATINSVIKNGGTTVATINSPVNAVPYALQAANASGSFSQVQADWNETNTASKAYIVNKPDLSSFITTETDPNVPAWAKEADKPVYQYSEIQNTPTIPTTVAQLTDAADYAKVADMNTALSAKADTAAVKAALNGKADANNVYTKAETDNLLNDKADAADLASKANAADVYTKAEADNLLNDKADAADLANKANAADVTTALGAKADTAAVKAALATKANTSDIHDNTITIQKNGETVASFTLNQNTDQTINLTVPTSGGGGTGVAQTINISGNVITLSDGGGSVTLPAETDPTVPAWAKTANKPVYDYSEIENTPNLSGFITTETDPTVPAWAKTADKPVYDYSEIQNTPNLGIYATTAAMNTALGAKADTAVVNAALNGKADKTATENAINTINTTLTNKANISDIPTTVAELTDAANYATVTAMNTALDQKADKTETENAINTINTTLGQKANAADVYTKTEMNTALNGKADTASVYTRDVMNTKLALKADNNAVFTKDETKDAISDSLDIIRAQMAALATQVNNLMTALNALQVTSEKFIATAGQTSFTLGGTPNGNVVCYVNGVMVGSTSATSANTVITVSGTTVTYNSSYNYNYTLQAGDVVTFMYVVRANN